MTHLLRIKNSYDRAKISSQASRPVQPAQCSPSVALALVSASPSVSRFMHISNDQLEKCKFHKPSMRVLDQGLGGSASEDALIREVVKRGVASIHLTAHGSSGFDEATRLANEVVARGITATDRAAGEYVPICCIFCVVFWSRERERECRS